jgi:hypothetical protein
MRRDHAEEQKALTQSEGAKHLEGIVSGPDEGVVL